MEQVKVHYDRAGNTLTLWFGDPGEERVCQEIGEKFILIKDHCGRLIGLEKLNFALPAPERFQIAFEVVCE